LKKRMYMDERGYKGASQRYILIFAAVIFFHFFESCTTMNYYEIRSMFLPSANYTGSICRVSDSTWTRILSPQIIASHPETERRVSRILAASTDVYGLSIYDPVSGYRLEWNSDLQFHAASTYKTAIFIAIMKMDQDKKTSVNDPIDVENNFQSIMDNSIFSVVDDPSEPDVLFSNIGNSVRIQELLSLMMEKSSNLATNLLIKNYGSKNINKVLRSIGSDIEVKRGVSDDKAYADCINNTVSAQQLENLYQLVFDAKVFDSLHQKQILEILKKNTETKILSANLPREALIAHKHGNTSKVFHDAGIIFPEPSGTTEPYFIAILTSGYRSEKKTSRMMARISKIIYDEVVKERLRQEEKKEKANQLFMEKGNEE